MNEVSNLMPNFHVYGRGIEEDAYHERFDPFEDATHPCPQCGRTHFVYNLEGRFGCQRCGTPMGQLVRPRFGRPRRQWIAHPRLPQQTPHAEGIQGSDRAPDGAFLLLERQDLTELTPPLNPPPSPKAAPQ
jgi:ribosomal protein S27AE